MAGELWPFQEGGKIRSQNICHSATYHGVLQLCRKSGNPKMNVIATFYTGDTLLGDSMTGFMQIHCCSFNSRLQLLVEYYVSLAMKFHAHGT